MRIRGASYSRLRPPPDLSFLAFTCLPPHLRISPHVILTPLNCTKLNQPAHRICLLEFKPQEVPLGQEKTNPIEEMQIFRPVQLHIED